MTVTETRYPYVEELPGKSPRLTRNPRMRVAWFVPTFRNFGSSVEEMCRQYPSVKPAEVHAVMAYYYDHSAEIDREIDEDRRIDEESRRIAAPSPFVQRMRAEGRL